MSLDKITWFKELDQVVKRECRRLNRTFIFNSITLNMMIDTLREQPILKFDFYEPECDEQSHQAIQLMREHGYSMTNAAKIVNVSKPTLGKKLARYDEKMTIYLFGIFTKYVNLLLRSEDVDTLMEDGIIKFSLNNDKLRLTYHGVPIILDDDVKPEIMKKTV